MSLIGCQNLHSDLGDLPDLPSLRNSLQRRLQQHPLIPSYFVVDHFMPRGLYKHMQEFHKGLSEAYKTCNQPNISIRSHTIWPLYYPDHKGSGTWVSQFWKCLKKYASFEFHFCQHILYLSENGRVGSSSMLSHRRFFSTPSSEKLSNTQLQATPI